MSGPERAGAFRALGVGARAARHNLGLWGFGLGLEAGLGLLRLAFSLSAMAVIADGFLRGAASLGSAAPLPELFVEGVRGVLANRVVLPLVGLAISVELLGAALRAFYLGASVQGLTHSARGETSARPGLVVDGAAAFARATLASLWLGLIELVVGLTRWVVLGSSLLMVRTAFQTGDHGWRAAAFAGFGAGLLGVVALAMALFARLYLVRAVRGPGSTLAAVSEAIDLLRSRALTYGGLLVADFVLAIGVATVASAPGIAAATAGPNQIGLQIAFRLLGALVTGALAAGVELIILGAVCAIDLDARGELPAPPPPPAPAPKPQPEEMVVIAQEVLPAEVVPATLTLPPEPST